MQYKILRQKEIAKPFTPHLESASEEDVILNKSEGLKAMQKIWELRGSKCCIGARETIRWSSSAKRLGYSNLTARNLVQLSEKGVQLQAEQLIWIADTDEEIDEQELDVQLQLHGKDSRGVAHKTNVSRPQPRSNHMQDKVVPYTSHAKLKKTEVEEHPRISSISNKTKSVTACNDSLNSRTSNANAVCATCGKCVFNSNHEACVSKFLNDVNARTKKPNVVPISTRKTKSQANILCCNTP
ncbi:hypothetical protein Tco_1399728 [Tanacetum coccineum]